MNDELFLLTMWFPYSPGEEFLETEIQYLSKAFDRVYLLPTSYLGSRQLSPRMVPGNVELLTDAVTYIQAQYARTRFKRALNWSRHPTYRAYMSQDLRQIITHGFKAIQQLLGFLSSSFIIFNALQMSPKASNVPLLYSYWLSRGTLAAITLREAGYPFKVVSRVHRRDLYLEHHKPPYLPLHGYMVSNVDRLFHISEHGLHYIQSRYTAATDRLVLSRLGVQKAPAPSRPSSDKRLHIVTCSSMAPVKRLDLWVRALMLCRVPVMWTHIGSGPEERKVRNAAAHLPAHVQYRFLGRMPNEDVLRYYAVNPVDLFVNTSRSEGLPVSIMEALSFGIPVMATSAGGTAELVSENSGILLPVDVSPKEIAAALQKFASLPAGVKSQMRRAAIADWESKANADNQYSRFIELLRDVFQTR
jgi:glycosyltransferase involved in cell wall biosynthesis